MLHDLTEGKLEEALEFAVMNNDPSLKNCLERLEMVDENMNTNTDLWPDFAPRSFEFVRKDSEGKFRSNGGVIFHGHHDNGGDGGSPTFSVCLTPVNGWSIHT